MIDLQNKIAVYPLTPDRLQHLQLLFYKVFRKKHSIEYLAKKYNTSYSKLTYGGHLAYCDSEPIAFTGIIPMPFMMDGNAYAGVQICDFMTLPEFRRKGVQKKIWEKNEELVLAHQIDFSFCFSQDVQSIDRTWHKKLSLKAYIIHLKNYKFKAILNKVWKQGFGNPEELLKKSFFQIASDQNAIPIDYKLNVMQGVYSPEILKYKAITPTIRCTSEDAYFWLKFRNVLEVGLLDACSEDKMRSGLNQLINLANKSRCSKVIFQVTPDSVLDKILAEQFSPIPGFEVMAKIFKKNLAFEKFHLNFCDLDTF